MITDLQVNPIDTVKLSFNIGGSSAEVLLKSKLNDTSSYFKLSEEVIRHSFIPAFTFNGNIYELSIHNFTPYATNITESIALEGISFFISNHATSDINVVKTKLNSLVCDSVLTVSSTSISNNALSGQTLLRVLTDRGDSLLSVSLGNTEFTDSIEKLRYTKPNTAKLTEKEITLKRILKSKVDRDMYLDKLAQKKGFLDANECFSYIHSTDSIKALDAQTLYAYRDYIDSVIKEEYTRTDLAVDVDRLDLNPIVW